MELIQCLSTYSSPFWIWIRGDYYVDTRSLSLLTLVTLLCCFLSSYFVFLSRWMNIVYCRATIQETITSRRLCKEIYRAWAVVNTEYYLLAQYCFYLSMWSLLFMYWSHHWPQRGVRSVLLMTNITFSQFDDKITRVDQRGLDKITNSTIIGQNKQIGFREF